MDDDLVTEFKINFNNLIISLIATFPWYFSSHNLRPEKKTYKKVLKISNVMKFINTQMNFRTSYIWFHM